MIVGKDSSKTLKGEKGTKIFEEGFFVITKPNGFEPSRDFPIKGPASKVNNVPVQIKAMK